MESSGRNGNDLNRPGYGLLCFAVSKTIMVSFLNLPSITYLQQKLGILTTQLRVRQDNLNGQYSCLFHIHA